MGMFILGHAGRVKILGIPIFFILFLFVFIVWILDFQSIKKYYNRSLLYFVSFGLIYVIISFIGGFYHIFEIPINIKYIFRQAYYLPYLFLAVPVFTCSFQFGFFDYFLRNKFLLVIIAFLFFPEAIFYSTILLYSINNQKLGIIVFLLFILIEGGLSTANQMALIQILIFIYFILRLNMNFKYISILILCSFTLAYFIDSQIIYLVSAIDSNSGWRLVMWKDSIVSTINDTLLFGHGFGTWNFSDRLWTGGEFVIDARGGFYAPLSTLRSYNHYDAGFVLTVHNSFITIFFRMGIIGLLLFLTFLLDVNKQIINFGLPKQFTYILLISIIIVGLNMGVESPGMATQFAFLISLIQYNIIQYCKTHKIVNN